MHTTYLGLGANLGRKEETLYRAIDLIEELIGHVEARSALYYSAPWGFQSDNQFVNAVVRVATLLTPQQLLNVTQHIERRLGKEAQHATVRDDAPLYKDRPIDIDILLYDQLAIDTPQLKIPHPLMRERDFVMIPLNEVLVPTYEDQEP